MSRHRCDMCVGFVRRDCTIMERCVQTGMRRHNDVTLRRLALAAATGTAKTAQQAECEASQSGPKGNAQNTPDTLCKGEE